MPQPFRIIQPWGSREKVHESTVVSSHFSAAEAFAAIDMMVEQMIRTGAPTDAVELLVVDANDQIIRRLAH